MDNEVVTPEAPTAPNLTDQDAPQAPEVKPFNPDRFMGRTTKNDAPVPNSEIPKATETPETQEDPVLPVSEVPATTTATSDEFNFNDFISSAASPAIPTETAKPSDNDVWNKVSKELGIKATTA